MKKLFFVMSFLLVFSLLSCSDSGRNNENAELIQLSESGLFLYEGQSYQLFADVISPNRKDSVLTWSSSRPEVCSVTDGLVTAVSEGVSIVTVRSGSGKATSVRVKIEKIEKVKTIILSDISLSLKTGDTHTFSASVTPASNAAQFPFIWSSSDESVATVDSYGTVTALADGACLIMADIEGASRAVCKVFVNSNDSDESDEANEIDLSSIVSVTVDGVPKTYNSVDFEGNTLVSGEISGCEILRELTADGRITVTVKLSGKKTFDVKGAEGQTPIYIKASLYEILPDGEEYKGTYGCSSGYITAGEDFEIKVRYFSDKDGYLYNTGGELAFNVEMKPQLKQFRIVLDYGEEEIS